MILPLPDPVERIVRGLADWADPRESVSVRTLWAAGLIILGLGAAIALAAGARPPYRYSSLKDLSNAEILRYMDRGERQPDAESEAIQKRHPPTQACAGFWSMAPKEAAVAIAEANRDPGRYAKSDLFVRNPGQRTPPEVCTINLWHLVGCESDGELCWSLRCDPKGSYLAFAAMSLFSSADMRYCELPYEDARHVAQTLWWLGLVDYRADSSGARTHSSESLTSSGDREGCLDILTDGGDSQHFAGIVSMGRVSMTWGMPYSTAAFISMADYILMTTLPEHLGHQWSQFHPAEKILDKDGRASKFDPKDAPYFREVSARFLDLFSLDERRSSLKLTQMAANVAEETALPDLVERLQPIQSALPAVAPAGLRYGREWRIAELRRTVESVLERAKPMPDDVPGLEKLALAGGERAPDALGLLRARAPDRYVAVLVQQLPAKEGGYAGETFYNISQADKAKALEIALSRPPGELGPLLLPAFRLAESEGRLGDPEPWLKALAAQALSRDGGFALAALAPEDDPTRYASPIVDETLLAVFRTWNKDQSSVRSWDSVACASALASRTGTDYFGDVLDAYYRVSTREEHDAYLMAALIAIGRRGGPEYVQRLTDLLRPEFVATTWGANGILWAAWSADARELKNQVEGLATAGPKEAESHDSGRIPPIHIVGRYHLARQIAALWNEDDPVTRAKLTIAFWLGHEWQPYGYLFPVHKAQIREALKSAVAPLAEQQRRQVEGFVQWYETTQVAALKEPYARKYEMERVSEIRKVLGMPPAVTGEPHQ